MKAQIKAPYFVILFVATIAMLLAPSRGVAQTVEKTSDDAAYAQQAQQPSALVRRERVRDGSAAQRVFGDRQYARRAEREYVGGRARFIISSTLASFYGGLELVDATGTEDLRLTAGMLAGTTGIGFLSSYLASRDSRITLATADAYDLGLLLGVGNGMLLSRAATDDERVISGVTVGTMVVGGATALAMAKRLDPTRGQVAFTALAAKLGMATAALGMTFTPEGMEDASSAALAGGMNIGAGIGLAVSPRIQWSLARTRLVGLGSFLGALAGWSAAALITGGDVTELDMAGGTHRALAAGALVGMWGGFGVSARLTRDMAPARRFRTGKKETTIAPAPMDGGLGLSLSGVF